MVDDVFFHGDTLDQNPASDKGRGVSNLLKQVAELLATYHKVILPIVTPKGVRVRGVLRK